MDNHIDTTIENLGQAKIPSPIGDQHYTSDDDNILYNVFENDVVEMVKEGKKIPSFQRAGAREKIFFEPSISRAAIVSCGGLCPGINNVIRSIVMQLFYIYGVRDILGIRYGYKGLNAANNIEPIKLLPDTVSRIHQLGGSILSSSRGAEPIDLMVDRLEQLRINMLFAIGGDGTLKGANAIAEEIKKRKQDISVVAIPKTIDNDISYVAKSFGFESAFSAAVQSIESAHSEAIGAPNGIGLVKLMGRYSGFIAANAALALKEVNFVLIPEVDFDLEGEKGLYSILKKRLESKKHAVIVVAEGAGQKFFQEHDDADASGNKKLGDIGLFLKQKINEYFKSIDMEVNLKYIDPSYIIRSVPANANDSVFCGLLAQNAVHAAMSGKTNMVIGVWNNMFVHLPINLVTSKRKHVDPRGKLWQSVMESTGQPSLING